MQKNLFIAGGTRTGSSHIRNCFGRMGLKPVSLYCGEEDAYNEEHMLDRTAANVVLPLGGFVCLHHIRAIGRNVSILRDHDIKPVVTYRNVLDCMVSWRNSHEDGIRKMGKRGNQWIFLPVYGPVDWFDLTEDDKWDWISFNVLPWWFSFYVSWRTCGLECLFVNYKEHYTNQINGIHKIVEWMGWEKSLTDKQLTYISEKQDGRFNIGKSGRGLEQLPQRVISRAYDLCASWGPHWGPKLRKFLLEEE